MTTSAINIPIDSELAAIYEAASPEEREKLQILVGSWLRAIRGEQPYNLSALMDEISDKAQARGLTPELLETLLRDND